MIDIKIEFEHECFKCEGSSKWSGVDCDRCGNTGKVPSVLGEVLLEFLEHQGIKRVTVEQERKS